MADFQPVSPLPSTQNPFPDTKTFAEKNKKMIIGVSIIISIIILLLIAFLFGRSQQENNSNGTNQSGQAIDSSRFAYWSENTCPEAVFKENDLYRADNNDNHYIVTDDSYAWIQQNCAGKTSGISGSNTPTNDANQNNQGGNLTNGKTILKESEPPALLKSIGFNLGAYDASTNKAGDIQFTKTPLMFNQIYSPYGQQDPRTTDTSKINPQPTVILPLGTKVLALIDGIVVEVKELYSGDMTVMLAKSENSGWIYEMEHIINPTVAKGDTVTAGQVIGEVSDYDSHNHPGFGLVEIGILHSNANNRPEHVCPYKYLDPSIEASVNTNLTSLYAAWEQYLGTDVYKQETFVAPGCVVETPFAE